MITHSTLQISNRYRTNIPRLVRHASTLLVVVGMITVFFFDYSYRAYASGVPRQVLAYYYGWYGNPSVSGRWRHWRGVDSANQRIENTTDFPEFGAYDSHDPNVVDRQAAVAHSAGITGFISSWWGRNSFEDRNLPLLLSAAGQHGMVVSVLYEEVHGNDEHERVETTVADFKYLLGRYSFDPAWLRVSGKPVFFVYGRALHSFSVEGWAQIIKRVRQEVPGGVLFLADSLAREYRPVFDGVGIYDVTSNLQHMTPTQIHTWAHRAFPEWVAQVSPGKISSVTVIPGYDDRHVGKPPPRPITDRWGDQTYRILWQEAISANPDYVLITSWNEWHEGSEIEPSIQYGSRFVDDTEIFSRTFLSGHK